MKRIFHSTILAAVLVFLCPLQALASENLIPVGKVIGLQLSDSTVTVAAYDDILGAAAREAGLKIGDEILKINEKSVRCPSDVRAALSGCGSRVSLTVSRGGRMHTLQLSPADTPEGKRLGVYLRNGIAGIGTVTWYDPDTGKFGTLGHGVSDSKGKLLHMTEGRAFDAEILSVKRGKCGDPGQLKGSADPERIIATLYRNTPQGVFGISETGWPGKALPTADYEDVSLGSAGNRSTVEGRDPQEYSVEILKIYPEDRSDGRNFLLRVTDPSLLKSTGGIVQGMSGSPIIQNGRLIGAVTHVLVNQPDTGYGIFIENMLQAAE